MLKVVKLVLLYELTFHHSINIMIMCMYVFTQVSKRTFVGMKVKTKGS